MSVGLEVARPRRRDDVWLRSARDETSIYDPATKAVHILNDTALAIWELCDGETEVQEMIVAICNISHLHRDVIQEDVSRVLQELSRNGLVLWN